MILKHLGICEWCGHTHVVQCVQSKMYEFLVRIKTAKILEKGCDEVWKKVLKDEMDLLMEDIDMDILLKGD